MLSLPSPSNTQEAALKLKYPGTAPILQGTNWEEELEGWKRNCVSAGKRQIEAQKTWARRKKVGTRWRASRLLGRETRVKSRRCGGMDGGTEGWAERQDRQMDSYRD